MIDQPLQFWFQLLQPDSPPLARVICMAERDNVFHVETLLRGRFFSAHFTEGVRFADSLPHQTDAGYWNVVTISEESTPEIEAWCESIAGSKYDTFGALNSAMGIPLRDPYRWFCSLVGEEIASRAGVLGLDPLPSPSKLRQQLKSAAGIVSASPTATFPVAGLKLLDTDLYYLCDLVADRTIDPDMAATTVAACRGET